MIIISNFRNFIKVKQNSPIYKERESSHQKIIGELIKGQIYPINGEFDDWYSIQFGDDYGYVKKEDTILSKENSIQNLNKHYHNQPRNFVSLKKLTVYDNTSGKLIPFAQLSKDIAYPIASDYRKWWRIIIADRIGYVRKSEVYVESSDDDKFFRVDIDDAPIYDNRRGYLEKIGSLKKAQVFSIESNRKNWWRVSFGRNYGYIKKVNTSYATGTEIKNLNESYSNSSKMFIPKQNVTVYDNTSGKLLPMGEIERGTPFPIATDYGNWWRIIYLGRIGYVKKQYLLPYEEQDIDQIIQRYKKKDTTHIMKRIRRFRIPHAKQFVKSAENMLSGKYRISNFGTFDFSNEIEWGDSPVKGKKFSSSYYRALHGHFFINDLIAAYLENGKVDYLYKGYEIIEDWISKNQFGKAAHRFAWHDEGTSTRLTTWVLFFDAAKDVLQHEKLKKLLIEMIAHADMLLRDSFHSTNTNHGMFQDEALIVFSDYFSVLSKSQLYYEIAKQRLKDYFNFIISKEGVHLEHSPGYHQIIARAVKRYMDYFKLKKDEMSKKYFEEIYNSMAKYYIWVIKPDGTVPLIGDTFSNVKPPKGLWLNNPYYHYVLTNGKEGKVPPYKSAIFKDAGYAIFRDDWSKGKNATYIHFAASYHTEYHKHSDDLSVWIYANGHDVITEAGPNGYDNHLPFTKYAYSSFAHNTLIVNDKGLPRTDGQYDKVYIEDYFLQESISRVKGINKRYEDVVHHRELIYEHDVRKIIIKDTIESSKENNYKLLWNLAPGVTPRISEEHIHLYIDGNEIMTVDFKSENEKFIITKVKGQKEPYYLGWHLKDRNVPVETYTLVVELDGQNVEVETIFKIK